MELLAVRSGRLSKCFFCRHLEALLRWIQYDQELRLMRLAHGTKFDGLRWVMFNADDHRCVDQTLGRGQGGNMFVCDLLSTN